MLPEENEYVEEIETGGNELFYDHTDPVIYIKTTEVLMVTVLMIIQTVLFVMLTCIDDSQQVPVGVHLLPTREMDKACQENCFGGV
jgi:hypothetical protein